MDACVRQAVVSDAEAIADIHIRGWQAAYRGILPDSFLDQLGQELERRTQFWRTEISSPTMPGHEVWVSAVDSNHRTEIEGSEIEGSGIQGFSSIGPSRDSDVVTAGEVYAIYVDPDRWGLGFGRALFTLSSERLAALEYSVAMLWVLESNARARRFYEIAGWIADGTTKVETRPGFDLREVRYKKSLPSKIGR